MSFQGWDSVQVKTKEGVKPAVAPVIISASRATDIPAFYSDWLMQRLKAGYVKWINPFNQQAQYITFAKTRVIVFWTKNAQPLIKHLPVLDQMGINYYFTFTVNDYEAEGLEPNLPKLSARMQTFRQLAKEIGKKKVIWRFDPLILGRGLTVEQLLEKVRKVGEELHPFTEKLVISFADIALYKRVQRNLISGGFTDYLEFDQPKMRAIAAGLQELNRKWGLQIATCGEEVDLMAYGITQNKCIDDQLMSELFPHDQVLMNFLGYETAQPSLFPSTTETGRRTINLKDKGQRQACGCIVSKDIGQYNTCMHLCKYCYANYSEKMVRRNYQQKRDVNAESILRDC
jgi:DNA repair photolyase